MLYPPAVREVARTVDGCLTGQLFEHLGGTGKPVTRLANGDVEDDCGYLVSLLSTQDRRLAYAFE